MRAMKSAKPASTPRSTLPIRSSIKAGVRDPGNLGYERS